jgi:hypothetical protein
MGREFNEIIEWCIRSIEQEPEAWEYDGHYAAVHRNGVRVWMANSYYGMGVNFGDAKIGGVTGWSSFFGGWIPWRRRLRHAVLAHLSARPAAERILDAIRAA